MFNSQQAQNFIAHATESHLENLKRVAKKAKKLNNTTLTYELDRLAETNGFSNWALLVKNVQSNIHKPKPRSTTVTRTIRNYMQDSSFERELMKTSCGLIVLAGVSGSGRTTVLTKWISYIIANSPRKVVNIGGGSWDDLQLNLTHRKGTLTTVHVREHVQSFEEGIANAMRHDSDIIIVSELRDAPTLKRALDAVESGHLVIVVRNNEPTHGTITKSILRMVPDEEREQVGVRLKYVLKHIVAQSFGPNETGHRERVQLVESYL